MKVDNAIIMAAGTSSRFAPISFEKPKALINVRGEILIERQIRQLKEAGIGEVVVVMGYKADHFQYLRDKFDVVLIHNDEYLMRNNNSSIYAVRDYLKNSYICSSDNYFIDNPFDKDVDESYYSSVYVKGLTNEWCIREENGWIKDVKIGGRDSWIMMGHVFWSSSFSNKFISILEEEYDKKETADKLWESIYIEHIGSLPMKIRKFPDNYIFEFDTLDELRVFDNSYMDNSGSEILKCISKKLGVRERDITNLRAFKSSDNSASGFDFFASGKEYRYLYKTNDMEEKNEQEKN